jgi:oligopeptidase B
MPTMKPPAARRETRVIEQLGRTRIDEYAWMRDDNWQLLLRDPSALRADIRAHLLTENHYTEAILAETEPLQAAILAEMRGRIREDDGSVPLPDGAFEYYARYAEAAQQPMLARRPRGGGEEQVLLDCEARARDSAYFRLGGSRHSHDHSLYAWAEDTQGSEVYRLHVHRIGGLAARPPIESMTGNFTFSPDDRFIFWTYRDDNGRPSRVYRSPTGGGTDVLVHDEADEGMFVSVALTASRRFVLITCGNQETTEAWFVTANEPEAAPRLVAGREAGLRYDVEDWDGAFVMRTNADGAIDFKLVRAPVEDPSRANWRDWRPHLPGRFITGMAAYAEHFVCVERADANDSIVIIDRATGAERQVTADEAAYALSVGGSYEFSTPTLRYHFESPTQPRQTFDLDLRSGARTLRKTQEVPSGHDPSLYEVRRLHATAADGALVPITVLGRRDALARGTCPTLLYGYGSYGIAMMPWFSTRSLSLVDRGWIWAVAHVRGGSEKGWGWFLDGRREHKTNTFTDFVTCADHLIATGYTERGRIVAHGGSAGGLLMGVALNMRPDLWAGVAASVPFVDALNTMSDPTLPLTPPEWPEWGNPLTDPASYDRIASWSPYDQVAAQDYPPVLALGGLSDPRVTYWEPMKWVARLRANTTGDQPIMLRINMEAGHGGASGRFDHLKEPALVQAFAIWAEARSQRTQRRDTPRT